MEQSSELYNKLNQIDAFIRQENIKLALELLDELRKEYPGNLNLLLNEPGIMINIGEMIRDENIITDAINKGEFLLDQSIPSEYEGFLHYNIANGYLELFKMESHEELSSILNSTNLQKAKYHLKQSIKTNPTAELLNNYGNCLDSLGRVVEALYCYDEALRIDPNHSMTIGNKALARKFFADISGEYRVQTYIEVYQELKSVIDKEDLLFLGGFSANETFKKAKLEIENLFEDKSILEQNIDCKTEKSKYATDFEKEYYNFCKEHKLFLNFHIGNNDCQDAVLDTVFIRIITDVNDDIRFYSLAKKLNDIKEFFLVSRLLLIQSFFRRDDFDSISNKVILVDTADYAEFGVYSALLKSSFMICYNILDKIAFFINDYLDLKMKDREIYFGTIWEDQKTKDIKDEIKRTNNISLYALFDVNIDLKQDKLLSQIRNSITHRKFTIYNSGKTDWDSKESKEDIGYDSMFSETVNLMKLVKSSIIYLMNFVEMEEEKKRRGNPGIIEEIIVDTYKIQ